MKRLHPGSGEFTPVGDRDLDGVAVQPSPSAVDVRRLEFVDSSSFALWVRWSNLVGHVESTPPRWPFERASCGRASHRLVLTPDELARR